MSIGGTDTSITTGDTVGALAFISADPSFTSTYTDGIAAQITAVAETSVGGGYGLAFTTGVTTGSDRTERMRIKYDGKVGIGTSNPASLLSVEGSSTGEVKGLILRNADSGTSGQSVSAIFEVSAGASGSEAASVAKIEALRTGGGATGDLLLHTTNAGVSSERMRIDASGNVGINEINPDEKLVVNTSSTGISKFVTAYSFQQRNAAIEIAPAAPNAGNGSGYIAQGLAGGGIGLYQGGTYYGGGNYKLYGNATSISSVQLEQGSIIFQASDGYSTGASPGNTERMRISSTGNVGINEGAPTRQMHIKAPGTGDSRNLLVDTTGTNGNAGIGFASGGNEEWALATIGTTGAQDLRLYNWNNTEEVLRVTDAGDVGIGNSAPTALLSVGKTTGSGVEKAVHIGLPTVDRGLALGAYTPSTRSDQVAVVAAQDTSGQLHLRAGGNTAANTHMVVDQSGSVGVGTTTPDTYGKFVVDNGQGRVILDGQATSTYNTQIGPNDSGLAYKALSDLRGHTWYNGSAGDQELMRIDSSGQLLVGKTAAGLGLAGCRINPAGDVRLSKTGAAADTMIAFYKNGSTTAVGVISSTDTATTYATSSDERLKDNIVDAPAGNIDSIRVRSFDWKVDGSHQEYGFIAQELETVAPYAVTKGETDEDMYAVDYSKLVPMLVKEIQDLKAEVEALKNV
jgi:hypothetical protein